MEKDGKTSRGARNARKEERKNINRRCSSIWTRRKLKRISYGKDSLKGNGRTQKKSGLDAEITRTVHQRGKRETVSSPKGKRK